jgi:hypothetical protein
MTPKQANHLMADLYINCLDDGCVIPLAWVVEHGESFKEAWAKCSEPDLLITVAAHVSLPKTVSLVKEISKKADKEMSPIGRKRLAESTQSIIDTPTALYNDVIVAYFIADTTPKGSLRTQERSIANLVRRHFPDMTISDVVRGARERIDQWDRSQ